MPSSPRGIGPNLPVPLGPLGARSLSPVPTAYPLPTAQHTLASLGPVGQWSMGLWGGKGCVRGGGQGGEGMGSAVTIPTHTLG